jgi:hypothetical protein
MLVARPQFSPKVGLLGGMKDGWISWMNVFWLHS